MGSDYGLPWPLSLYVSVAYVQLGQESCRLPPHLPSLHSTVAVSIPHPSFVQPSSPTLTIVSP